MFALLKRPFLRMASSHRARGWGRTCRIFVARAAAWLQMGIGFGLSSTICAADHDVPGPTVDPRHTMGGRSPCCRTGPPVRKFYFLAYAACRLLVRRCVTLRWAIRPSPGCRSFLAPRAQVLPGRLFRRSLLRLGDQLLGGVTFPGRCIWRGYAARLRHPLSLACFSGLEILLRLYTETSGYGVDVCGAPVVCVAPGCFIYEPDASPPSH